MSRGTACRRAEGRSTQRPRGGRVRRMSRSKNRFEVAEEQVGAFLGRIGPAKQKLLEWGFPRRVESITRAALAGTTVEFVSLPALSDALIRDELRSRYRYRGSFEESREVLMGRVVVYGDRCVVFSNPDFGAGTERFTKAHEVGHLALDLRTKIPHVDQMTLLVTEAERVISMPRDLPGVIPMDGRVAAALDDKERYANLFAAEFLMPRADVRARVEGIEDEGARVDAVMATYGASVTAARVRLKEMRLFAAEVPAMTLFERAQME
ncbi:MAG: ImmA/IrrE family metallo-endopeptidase [Polyangiales bacterium]